MPTVLHMRTVTGRGGGPEKTLLASGRFIGEGYSLRLAYIRPAEDPLYDMPTRAAQEGAALIDIPERNGFDHRTWSALTREIRSSRPNLLHAHDYKTNMLAVLLGKRFRLPALTTLHGYGLGGGRLALYYRVERWALRRMTRIIAVSEDIADYVVGLGVPKSRCVVVPNGIDTDHYRRRLDALSARERIGIAPGALVVGAVGRLHPEKAFDLLMRAVHRLQCEGIRMELLIVGEGDDRGRLEALAVELGCKDYVRFLGYRNDTIDLYQAMDVFVLSSLREASPNVVLEAMALQVPVVATSIASVPQVITNGENGLLVEPDDVNGLVAALRKLAADGALRRRLGDAGRETVEQIYTFRARMQRIRSIYDEILGRTCTSP